MSNQNRGSVTQSPVRQSAQRMSKTGPGIQRKNSRIDFLQNKRKPSSLAFPLMGSGNGLTNKEDVYEFENRLRDVIAELTKPIYEK